MQLTGLYIYPVKSLAGIRVERAHLTPQGLEHDRRWMLVRPDGRFITAREKPQLVLLQPEMRASDLTITHKRKAVDPLFVPGEPETQETLTVQVWGDKVEAQVVSLLADAWFSEQIGEPCRLVYMPDTARRQVDQQYAKAGEIVSFADGYPYLIIGQASLEDLNARLENAVEMARFRPNLVFSGGTAYAEDDWTQVKVGDATFRAVKRCARCVLTTVDPETGQKGVEPLKTLASYRTWERGIRFGMNLLPLEMAEVKVGDELTVA